MRRLKCMLLQPLRLWIISSAAFVHGIFISLFIIHSTTAVMVPPTVTMSTECCQYGQWFYLNNSCICENGNSRGDLYTATLSSATCPNIVCSTSLYSQVCDTDPVALLPCCYQDCLVGQWSAWSKCQAPCNNAGVRIRKRPILTEAACGGSLCPNLEEQMECRAECCPVDCVLDSWSVWSDCSNQCGYGKRRQTRKVLQAPLCGGQNCSGLLSHEEICLQYASINCSVSSWSAWGDCTPSVGSCGPGTKARSRVVLVEPQCLGEICPPLSDQAPCNGPCCPVDCILSQWSTWSFCSTSCGKGSQYRYRNIISPASCGGLSCPPESGLFESAACTFQEKYNCSLTEWSPWSSCSEKCGIGERIRQRNIQSSSSCMEEVCDLTGVLLTDTELCESADTSYSCEVGEWTPWSDCIMSHSGGVRWRNRAIKKPSACKQLCPALQQMQACPVDKACEQESLHGTCACRPGYVLNTTTNHTCSPVQCPPLPPYILYVPPIEKQFGQPFQYAQLKYMSTNEHAIVGTTAMPVCEGDFELAGDVAIFLCQADGTWSQEYSKVYCRSKNRPPKDILLTVSTVKENQPHNFCFSQVTSMYADLDDANDFYSYELVENFEDRLLLQKNVTDNSTWLCLNYVPNYEAPNNNFSITIRSTDQNGLSLNKTFSIEILNENEAPRLCQPEQEILMIHENPRPGEIFSQLHICDEDSPLSEVDVLLLDSDEGEFDLVPMQDSVTGSSLVFMVKASASLPLVCTQGGGPHCPLNTESRRGNEIVLLLSDHGNPPQSAIVIIDVVLENRNDKPSGVTIGGQKSISVTESNLEKTFVGKLGVEDEDAHSTYQFSLTGDSQKHFHLEEDSLYFHHAINFESNPYNNLYIVTVQVVDEGSPTWTITGSVTVVVENENEPPSIASVLDYGDAAVNLTFQVKEGAPAGTILATLMLCDPDLNDTIALQVNHTTGAWFNATIKSCENDPQNDALCHTVCFADLMTVKEMNFHAVSKYQGQVTPVDASHHQGASLSFTVTKEIPKDTTHVLRIDDGPLLDVYSVVENNNGFVIGKLSLTGSLKATFTLIYDETGKLEITSDNVLKVHDDEALDYENALQNNKTDAIYHLRIVALDHGLPILGMDTVNISIRVIDINEPPSKMQLSSWSIDESTLPGAVVATISCFDPDKGQACILYELIYQSINETLKLQNGNQLVLKKMLNYEQVKSFWITLVAYDNGAPAESLQQSFSISVLDSNDAPEFMSQSVFFVYEKVLVGHVVGFVLAADEDIGQLLNYDLNLSPNNDSLPFSLLNAQHSFPLVGVPIIVSNVLNYEAKSSYEVVISVSDDGSPSMSALQTIRINITNENEAPKSDSLQVEFQIAEQTVSANSPALHLGTVHIYDDDMGDLLDLSLDKDDVYSGLGTESLHLAVSPSTCGNHSRGSMASPNCSVNILLLSGTLNFEVSDSLRYVLTARDTANAALAVRIRLVILDVNDAPTGVQLQLAQGAFITTLRDLFVKENIDNYHFGKLIVLDEDADQQHTIYFFNEDGQPSDMLRVKEDNQLWLNTKLGLDFETRDNYRLLMVVFDSGNPKLSYKQNVTLFVEDVNEPASDIRMSNDTVKENTAAGTFVAHFLSVDPDLNDTLTYILVDDCGGRFKLQNNSDLVVANSADLNFEITERYSIVVIARDSGFPTITKNGSFIVHLGDVNEPPTNIYLSGEFISLDALPLTLIGNLSALDPDKDELLTFTLPTSDYSPCFIIQESNRLVRSTQSAACPMKMNDVVVLPISVTDTAGHTLTVPFNIYVTQGAQILAQWFSNSSDEVHFAANHPSVKENVGPLNLGYLWVYSVDGSPFTVTSIALVNGSLPLTVDLSSLNAEHTMHSFRMKLTHALDYEATPQLLVTFLLQIGGTTTPHHVTFILSVENVNEKPLGIDVSPSEGLHIAENSKDNIIFGRLLLRDPDAEDTHWGSTNNTELFRILNGSEYFVINSAGYIALQDGAELDYERESEITIVVQGMDTAGHTIMSEITIAIDDVNEAPTGISAIGFQIVENSDDGALVGHLSAIDPDNGGAQGGKQSHSFVIIQNADDRFFVDTYNNLRVRRNDDVCRKNSTRCYIDYEENTAFSLLVRVLDSGLPTLSADVLISFPVINVDEPPVNMHLEFHPNKNSSVKVPLTNLKENTPVGSMVGAVYVIDKDLNHTYDCYIAPGAFTYVDMNPPLNEVSLSVPLDFEKSPKISVKVRCREISKPTLWVSQEFQVFVSDENEPPTSISISATQDHLLEFHVSEDVIEGSVIGTIYFSDEDLNDELSILCASISEENQKSSSAVFCNPPKCTSLVTTGMTKCQSNITCQNSTAFNYELYQRILMEVNVTDKVGNRLTRQLTVIIDDVNDPPSAILCNTMPISLPSDDSTLRIQEKTQDLLLCQLSVLDEDDDKQFEFYLKEVGQFLPLEIRHGSELWLSDQANLDYYKLSQKPVATRQAGLSFTLFGHAPDGEQVETRVTVTVVDEEELVTHLVLTSPMVWECVDANSRISQLISEVKDSELVSAQWNYTLLNHTDVFYIEQDGLYLQPDSHLDYEKEPKYWLSILVSLPSQVDVVAQKFSIPLEVMNCNEPPYNLSLTLIDEGILENRHGLYHIGTLSANDDDAEQTLRYVIDDSTNVNGLLWYVLNKTELYLATSLNYEREQSVSITVVVYDSGSQPMQVNNTFVIQVLNVNDPPQFNWLTTDPQDHIDAVDSSHIVVVRNETLNDQSFNSYNIPLARLEINEEDVNDEIHVRTTIDSPLFNLSPWTKETPYVDIFLVGPLDYEIQSQYEFALLFSDNHSPEHGALFTLNVNNLNEAPSNITLLNEGDEQGNVLHIPQDILLGTIIGRVVATDVDGGKLTYRLLECYSCSGLLVVNSFTGDVYVIKSFLDFEISQEAWMSVDAVDEFGAQSQPLSITIGVVARNKAPVIVGVTFDEVSQYMKENTELGNIIVEDVNKEDIHNCSLTLDNIEMLVDSTNNQLIKTPSAMLLMKSQVNVIIQCTDNGRPPRNAPPKVLSLPVTEPLSTMNEVYELVFSENDTSSLAGNDSIVYTDRIYIDENVQGIRLGHVVLKPKPDTSKLMVNYAVNLEQFSISEEGDLRLVKPLDYESASSLSVNITASYLHPHNGGRQLSICILKVQVVNANEQPTAFQLTPTNGYPMEKRYDDGSSVLLLQEHAQAGMLLSKWHVTDPDNLGTALWPQNHTLHSLTVSAFDEERPSESATAASTQPILSVLTNQSMNSDYWIFTDQGISTLSPGVYKVSATVSDDGAPPMHLNVTFFLLIQNVNDPPTDIVINLVPTALNENLPSGMLVGNISVVDPDVGDNHQCTISSFYWTLHDERKELFVSKAFDYESTVIHTFEIDCTDSGGLRITRSWNLPIHNINEPPTNLGISNSKWLEQSTTGKSVVAATLTALDPERKPLQYIIQRCDDGSVPCPVALQDPSNAQLILNDTLTTRGSNELALSFSVSDGEYLMNETVQIQIIRQPLFNLKVSLKLLNVTENSPPGSRVGTVEYPETGDKPISCSIFKGSDLFKFDGSQLVTLEGAVLDFERQSEHLLEVACYHQDTLILEQQGKVQLLNQNEPLQKLQFLPFINDTRGNVLLISELFPTEVEFGLVEVMEDDMTIGNVLCEQVNKDGTISLNISQSPIMASDSLQPFHLWRLSLTQPLDYESQSLVTMSISCRDEVSEVVQTWSIAVKDENEPPQGIDKTNLITSINLDSWSADTPLIFLGDVVIIDPDRGQEHDIQILQGSKYFMINGSRSLYAQNLQFAWVGEMSLAFEVFDNGIPRLSNNFTISFQFIQSSGYVNISSNMVETRTPAGFSIGVLSYHISSRDIIGTSRVNFTLVQNPNQLFAIKEDGATLALNVSGSTLQFTHYDLSVSAIGSDGSVLTTSNLRIYVTGHSPCLNHTCPSNSQCQTTYSTVATYRCTCLNKYIPQKGDRESNVTKSCVINPYNPCQSLNNPCQNGGTCVFKEDTNSTQCICSGDYFGDRCENYASCANITCVHGECQMDVQHVPRCQCYVGFSGDQCQSTIDECLTWGALCENNGTCLDRNNSFVCQCPNNTSGERCQFDATSCSAQNRQQMQCAGQEDVCIPAQMKSNQRITEAYCIPSTPNNTAHVAIPVPSYVTSLSDLKTVFSVFTEKFLNYNSNKNSTNSTTTTKSPAGRRRRSDSMASTNGTVFLINATVTNGEASFYFVVIMPDNSLAVPSTVISGVQNYCEDMSSKGQNETLFCPAFNNYAVLRNGTVIVKPADNGGGSNVNTIVIASVAVSVCLVGMAIFAYIIIQKLNIVILSQQSGLLFDNT